MIRGYPGAMLTALVSLGALDPLTPYQRRMLELCDELRRIGVRPRDVQAKAECEPWPFDEYARVALMEHTERCRSIAGYAGAAPTRLRRYKVACRARSLFSFAASVMWARRLRRDTSYVHHNLLLERASWAMTDALELNPQRHLEGLLRDAQVRWAGGMVQRQAEAAQRQTESVQRLTKRRELVVHDDLVPAEPTAGQRAKINRWYEEAMQRGKLTSPAEVGAMRVLEVTGRRGPGRQLRDERERVGEPLRILAAYAGMTPTQVGEFERGVVVPTPEQWSRLREALPGLGDMEAPPTEAERSPVVVGIDRALHPAGRCTCVQAGTCEWCEMNRRRELREARAERRREEKALRARHAELAMAGAPVEQPAKRNRSRAAKKARRGW